MMEKASTKPVDRNKVQGAGPKKAAPKKVATLAAAQSKKGPAANPKKAAPRATDPSKKAAKQQSTSKLKSKPATKKAVPRKPPLNSAKKIAKAAQKKKENVCEIDEVDKQGIKPKSPKKPAPTIISSSTPNPVHHFAAASGLTLTGLAGMAYGLQQPRLSLALFRSVRLIVEPPRFFLDPFTRALGGAFLPVTQQLQSQTIKFVLDALEAYQAQNRFDEWLVAAMAKAKLIGNDKYKDLPHQSTDCWDDFKAFRASTQDEDIWQPFDADHPDPMVGIEYTDDDEGQKPDAEPSCNSSEDLAEWPDPS
jgi:hypothetical protein